MASNERTDAVSGRTVRHGTGVTSTRAFPTNPHPGNVDPFVLFERFYIDPGEEFPMYEPVGSRSSRTCSTGGWNTKTRSG